MPKDYANSTTAYTEAINLLDYSVTVIPVTKADQNVDKADPDYKPLNDVDAKNWNACKCRAPRIFLKRILTIVLQTTQRHMMVLQSESRLWLDSTRKRKSGRSQRLLMQS